MMKKHWSTALLLLAVCCLYLFTAPLTVQSGDTGELVTNAYFLRVTHPPGYPLWTLLYHLPTRYLEVSTPFHRAALLTILISVIWLGFIMSKFRDQAGIYLALILASTLLFWRYAILPEVFSLHLLFILLVFWVFIQPQWLNQPWMIFLISLSVAHHHTIIFVFPLYIAAIAQVEHKKKVILLSVVFGLLSLSIYYLLTFFHPETYGSWSYITDIKAVINHFLRNDYGTFSLVAEKEDAQPIWLLVLIKHFATNMWSVGLGIIYVVWKNGQKLKEIKWSLATLGLCIFFQIIVFIIAGTISLNSFREAVLERFFLQPMMLVVLSLIFILHRLQIELPKWLLLAMLINAGLNVQLNFGAVNYRQNSSTEDFALNIMNSLPAKSVYYSFGDTHGGATYYLHDVLQIRPDLVHLHASLQTSWGLLKASKKYPEIINEKATNVIESLKATENTIYSNIVFEIVPDNFQVSLYGVAIKYQRKGEIPFEKYVCGPEKNYQFRYRPKLEDLNHLEVSWAYDLEYGRCYLARAIDLIKEKQFEAAKSALEEALKLSPLSTRVQERLCYVLKNLKSKDASACEARLEELITYSNRQYYLFQY